MQKFNVGSFSKSSLTHSNRGMSFEDDINLTNEYYNFNKIALVYKKPTPISVSKMDYTNNIITNARFIKKSTTDYNGVYKGYYIDFEVKETANENYFPLNNLKDHQMVHLDSVLFHKGIAFIIIKFTSLNKIYFVLYEDFKEYLINNTNASYVPIDFFENNCLIIKEKYTPRIDYIECIDIILSRKRDYEKVK